MSQRPRAASQPGRPPSIQSPRLLKGLRRRALSTQPAQGLEEELTCTVCCEIFHEPVVLNCTHSFCQSCLQQFWRKNPAGRQCPVCRRRCSSTEPPISLTLKNVAETFLRQKESEPESGQIPGSSPKVQCPAHEEVLKLFCQDDEETLCFVCHMSRKHTGHQVCPLEEAVLSRKEELIKDIGRMKKNLRQLYEAKQEYDDMAVHLKNQLQRTERQMKEEFDQLHQFLQKEEADRIAALRDEHERKSQLVKRKTECLMRDILSISNTIIGIDNEISASDALFLQNYKITRGRAQCATQDPEKLSGALIDEATHLSSLKYRVWEKMLGIVKYTPVTLDPNTAYAWLSLSSDLTSVTNAGNMQEVPDNPERFNHLVFVLGSEGFLSGQHAWEVEVGNKDDWVLGVVKESINRKGKVSGRPEDGFWTIALCEGQFTAMTTPRTTLQVEGPLEKVRVQLDCDAGLVVFSNPVNMTTIYTFKDHFIEKMFPFFCPGANINGNNSRPLKICPVRVAIWNSATW
ncbi:E3 ubiquitin-protein ligase TRIM39-like [Scleropages formosus]|uniref:E3 ubiquitin-protein ligase TRIM39-like n=1 Tax=Scleropages formosus TaxID=113540 RepID=A0A0P7UNG7_SCLFO|nr:E3 ubiquitin-protein ligase TRIM39-like [Scleropages formosus]